MWKGLLCTAAEPGRRGVYIVYSFKRRSRRRRGFICEEKEAYWGGDVLMLERSVATGAVYCRREEKEEAEEEQEV